MYYYCHYVCNIVMDVITCNLYTTSDLSTLLHGLISLTDKGKKFDMHIHQRNLLTHTLLVWHFLKNQNFDL